MSQEFKIGEKGSKKNNFGRRHVEVSLLRTVLERAHMQKSLAMTQEFNPKVSFFHQCSDQLSQSKIQHPYFHRYFYQNTSVCMR